MLIFENYALAVIGEFPVEKSPGMLRIVQGVWTGGDDWMQTVRAKLGWQESIDDAIRDNWVGYQQAARKQHVTGSPAKFAMMFADAIAPDATPSA
ncbi:MAG: hypothetical protein JRI68_25385 [Deltaproteobacteria bacterium]|nr:hypothetical protein [Deltaproteobacteria bacterium]